MAKKKKQKRSVQISAPLAYVQAVDALAVAERYALEHKDHASLVDIANSWIEIGNSLLTNEIELVYDEEDSHVVYNSDQPIIGFGFTRGSPDAEEEPQPGTGPGPGLG